MEPSSNPVMSPYYHITKLGSVFKLTRSEGLTRSVSELVTSTPSEARSMSWEKVEAWKEAKIIKVARFKEMVLKWRGLPTGRKIKTRSSAKEPSKTYRPSEVGLLVENSGLVYTPNLEEKPSI